MPVDPEDACHIRMEQSICDECLDGGAPLEMRIDRDQRLRPKAPARLDCVDLVSDILGADLSERANEARVIRNECAIQIKEIHDGYCSFKARANPTGGRSARAIRKVLSTARQRKQ